MKRIYFASIFLIAGLILSACNLPVSPSNSPGAAATSVAQTVQAVLAVTGTAGPLEPSATPPAATPTMTAVPCDDNASYTTWTRNKVPFTAKEAAKSLAANSAFSMSWTIKNTGACTWNSAYQMIQESGTPLSNVSSFPLLPSGKLVAPGETVTIELEMTAPGQSGDYQTSFSLVNDHGKDVITFGVSTKVGKAASQQSPSSPGNLQYTYDCTSGSVSISLLWADRSSDEQGYRVYRDGAQVGELPAGSTSFIDTVPSSGIYEYSVAAFNPSGEAPASISVNTANCK